MPVSPKDSAKDEEAFLSRWSRRKRTDPVEGPVEEDAPESAADSMEEMTDEEILAELDLPDPDTMKDSDDFSAFMQARVPEQLRRRALRVLWRSNPVLANLDGMVDYGEDFTDSATVIENMQTVYEVGKGAAEKWKRHLAALAEAGEDDEEGGDTPDTPAMLEVAANPEPETVPGVGPDPEPLPAIDGPAPIDTAVEELSMPRHMRFSFD